MSQQIKCTDCNAVLASLRIRTMIVKPVDPEIPEFNLSYRDTEGNPKVIACPGCGQPNNIN